MTLMELGGFILIVIGCAAPPKPPEITAQLAQQSRGFARRVGSVDPWLAPLVHIL